VNTTRTIGKILQKNLKIDITDQNVINVLHDKFKQRDEKSYEERIDKALHNFDIITEQVFWTRYIESYIIVGYSEYKGESITTILETIKFENEIFAYLLYRIFLLLIEPKSIYLHIQVHSNKGFYKKKCYVDELFTLHSISYKGGIDKVIKQMDADFKTVNIAGLKFHGNTKKITANLLGYSKRNNYNWNTNDNRLDEKVKILQVGQKKRVRCPLCKGVKEVTYNNKRNIFQYKNRKVIFSCDHTKSDFIAAKKIEILIDKSDLPLRIDVIDFVFYNWAYFSKQWLENNNNDKE